MKRIVLFLTIVLYCFSVSAQQEKRFEKFTLNGKVIGRNDGFIWLWYIDENEREINDSTFLKNGTFSFTGFIKQPTGAYIRGVNKPINEDGPAVKYIYIEPTQMQITIKEKDFQHAELLGSKTQNEKAFLNASEPEKRSVQLNIECDTIYSKIKAGDTSTVTKNKLASLLVERQIYKRQIKLIEYAFITSHPKSYLSPFLMIYYFRSQQLPLDSAELFYNSFDALIKQSKDGRYINSLIIARRSTAIGDMAPEFIKTDKNGKKINLAAFRGKSCIILDFWASWCQPCHALTPYLKSIYAQYHLKGLDVISISLDVDKKAWKRAIVKDNIAKWYNIDDGDAVLKTKYSVGAIPTYILIDIDGKIVGRYFSDEKEGKNDLNEKLKAFYH